jgi:hypothetical protein
MEATHQPETDKYEGLWLTQSLYKKLHVLAKIGLPLVLLVFILSLFSTFFSLHYLFENWQNGMMGHSFYLMEGSNPYRALKFLTTALPHCFMFCALFQSYKAWTLLRHSETDDDALLEGTKRLVKMFRWLVFCGAANLAAKFLWDLWYL